MLSKAELSKKQKSVVDRAISAVNDCGSVAYELGLQDGIKLMSGLKEIKLFRQPNLACQEDFFPWHHALFVCLPDTNLREVLSSVFVIF